MNVEKRSAFEPPAVLVERETPPPRMRRPIATSFGAVLVVLRVLAGVVWLVALAVQWDHVLTEDLDIELEPGTDLAAASDVILAVVLVVGAIILLAELALALLVYRGSNWARITVMVFATLSISGAAIDYFSGDAEITLRTTLITLSLDILVLLALSSHNARAYARRPRSRPVVE
ncbi:hypothetical protein J7E29_05920 [Streptomyces sp. ISL-90]|nr:hypothetical protein [Streptomyces sp. ISL-90]